MRASTSRLVYCLGLLAVTACAVLPETLSAAVTETPAATPLTAEVRLAHAIRDRVELTISRPAGDPGVVEASATETALRDLAFADDVSATRKQLISALANELSMALATRSTLSTRDAADPELVKADAVVSGLTAAINAEVRRNRI